MQTTHKKRWTAIGAAFGAGVAAVVVASLAAFAGSGHAAGAAKPVNTSPPTISGTPQEGKQLHGDRGNWDNNPDSYAFAWLRCDNDGGSCSNIGGANTQNYTLKSADVGNTVRFRVRATNNDGQTTATSVPTAVIQKASTTPPPAPTGCPPAGSNQVSQMSLPARLIIDQFQSSPSTLDGGTQSFVLRVHITSTCGGSVQGAIVYGTPTPFNQFGETQSNTASDGWATLNFSRQPNFPVNGKQGILAMFLRASKPGESVLAGITGFRLVNVNVSL
jgi:hypothetical protein